MDRRSGRPAIWTGIAALCGAVILVSCGGGAGSASPPGSTHASADQLASPSASMAPSTPAGTSAPQRQDSISIAGDERTVDLYIPAMPAGQQAPLIVLLHPNGGSPFSIERLSNIGVLAAREDVIVALPPAASSRRTWDAVNPESPDEAYVVGLIDHLLTTLPIDPDRVYVAGFSMGAVLSERIACRFADRVAAVALDAGNPWSDECSPTRPVSILIMHGTADTTFPIESVVEMVEQWRSLDGCQGSRTTTQLSPIAESVLDADCEDGAAVQYVRYLGAIHQWFTNPDATDVLWTFFQAHPRQ